MQLVVHLITTYGYIVVLLVVMAESAGLPLPGESSLLVASAYAATGKLWIPGVIAAAALGAILGDTAGYWVGRTSGVSLLRRHGRLIHFDEDKLARAERFFERHGEKAVFFGRFVPVGRVFSAVLAGVSRMHYRRFLLWNAAGGIVWASLMGTLGYLFGSHLPLIERFVRQFGIGLLLLIVAGIVVRLLLRRHGAGFPGLRLVALPALRARIGATPRHLSEWLNWRWSQLSRRRQALYLSLGAAFAAGAAAAGALTLALM